MAPDTQEIDPRDAPGDVGSLAPDVLRMIRDIVNSESASITQRLQAAKFYRDILAETQAQRVDSDIGDEVMAFLSDSA